MHRHRRRPPQRQRSQARPAQSRIRPGVARRSSRAFLRPRQSSAPSRAWRAQRSLALSGASPCSVCSLARSSCASSAPCSWAFRTRKGAHAAALTSLANLESSARGDKSLLLRWQGGVDFPVPFLSFASFARFSSGRRGFFVVAPYVKATGFALCMVCRPSFRRAAVRPWKLLARASVTCQEFCAHVQVFHACDRAYVRPRWEELPVTARWRGRTGTTLTSSADNGFCERQRCRGVQETSAFGRALAGSFCVPERARLVRLQPTYAKSSCVARRVLGRHPPDRHFFPPSHPTVWTRPSL